MAEPVPSAVPVSGPVRQDRCRRWAVQRDFRRAGVEGEGQLERGRDVAGRVGRLEAEPCGPSAEPSRGRVVGREKLPWASKASAATGAVVELRVKLATPERLSRTCPCTVRPAAVTAPAGACG